MSGDRRISVREAGVASRTLAEHQLLRAGADPVVLWRQPTAHNHREAVQQVLGDEVDGAVVPIAEGQALGLQGTALATLELSLLVKRAVAERELKHLGVVVAGAVRAALSRLEVDVDGAISAIA